MFLDGRLCCQVLSVLLRCTSIAYYHSRLKNSLLCSVSIRYFVFRCNYNKSVTGIILISSRFRRSSSGFYDSIRYFVFQRKYNKSITGIIWISSPFYQSSSGSSSFVPRPTTTYSRRLTIKDDPLLFFHDQRLLTTTTDSRRLTMKDDPLLFFHDLRLLTLEDWQLKFSTSSFEMTDDQQYSSTEITPRVKRKCLPIIWISSPFYRSSSGSPSFVPRPTTPYGISLSDICTTRV
jgi:hypothetical protein